MRAWRSSENVVNVRIAIPALILVLGCGEPQTQEPVKAPPLPTQSDLTLVEPKPAPSGVALRLNPKAGASVTNTLRGEIDVEKVPGMGQLPAKAIGKTRISMDYSVSVADSDASSVTLAFESSPLKLEGVAQGNWEQLGGQKGEVRFDRRAGILEDPMSLFEGLFGAGMVLFPESPIARGSTWSSENTRDMPPFGPVKVKESFTYRGLETHDGAEVHRIDSKASGLEGMKMSATYLVRKDGLPHGATIETHAKTLVATAEDGTEVWAAITVKVQIEPRR
jgi:hypothetical protein